MFTTAAAVVAQSFEKTARTVRLRMRREGRLLSLAAVLVGVVSGAPSAAAAPAAAAVPTLGAAQSFGVVAGSAVTNTGPTRISGDLGVSPGSAVTGFPPGQFLAGAIHAADAMALAAQNSVMLAYNALAAEECTANLTGQDLGGLTLTPGVYCFDTSAQLTGTLTLDAQGNSAAPFIFKIGSTLTTASGSSVSLLGGASPCSLFWQVGSSATLGVGSTFAGNILAFTSITVTSGTALTGRALARNGAVTLDTSAITAPCAVVAPACQTIVLAPPTAANGTLGALYSQLFTASGGTGPYTFSVIAGAPPDGLSLAASGLLAGTPTTAASYSFTVRAVDVNACGGSLAYSVVIATQAGCPVITLTPAQAPGGTVGVAYSHALAGNGGAGPYTFSVSGGTLPAGMALTTAGLLSGTPTSAGTSTFTVRASDANSCAGTLAYSVVIAAAPPPECPAITLTPGTAPGGTVGVAYSQALAGNGGSGPYSFSVSTGTLPAGMALTTAGVLSGTPTSAGTSTFTVRAVDANSCPGALAYSVVIAAAAPGCPVITLTPATPPNGTIGVAYSQAIVGSGGTGPYVVTLATGTLPAGLTLTPAGVLSGTPTTGGSVTFTLRGTDANGCFAEAAATVLIASAVPALPQAFLLLLAFGLLAAGYMRLRRLVTTGADTT